MPPAIRWRINWILINSEFKGYQSRLLNHSRMFLQWHSNCGLSPAQFSQAEFELISRQIAGVNTLVKLPEIWGNWQSLYKHW